MSALADFQSAFVAALHDEASTFGPATQPAFAVYRNTVMRACLDALEANFPAVVCLVGRDWFRAAAAVHVAQAPPRDARLTRYGEGFPDFLAAFEPAMALPYLPDVARIDRLWNASFDAADAAPVPVAWLATLSADELAEVRLVVHPAARWLLSSMPVRSIWQASRAGIAVEENLAWLPEGVLIVRGDHDVHALPVEPAGVALLEAIAGGASLAEAAASTTTAHAGSPVDLILSGLLRSGALAIY